MMCCINVGTRRGSPSNHRCRRLWLRQRYHIFALRLHVCRRFQHSGPRSHIFKPCYELHVYIWASQQSTNYFANVHHRGQLCTRRPALAQNLRSSHLPMMVLQPSRDMRHLSWKLMGRWPGMPRQPCHPPHPRKLQVHTTHITP
jgi:hypothetical protein